MCGPGHLISEYRQYRCQFDRAKATNRPALLPSLSILHDRRQSDRASWEPIIARPSPSASLLTSDVNDPQRPLSSPSMSTCPQSQASFLRPRVRLRRPLSAPGYLSVYVSLAPRTCSAGPCYICQRLVYALSGARAESRKCLRRTPPVAVEEGL